MTTLKLAKYTDDDLRLQDVGDAEFLRRKIESDTTLDFTGVTEASAAFLDALLEGETAESIGDRLEGMNAAVDEALAAWVDRASAPVKPIERSRPRPRVRVTKPSSPPPALERPPITDDRFTPTRLVQRLSDSLRGYIESAYPLSDPTLVRARRRLLETEAGGHLLAQEPFIETTTRYASSPHGYDELGLPSHVGEFFSGLAETPTGASAPEDERRILYPSMYGHQERAFTSFLVEGKDIVVATGTGSGKTECFRVPMLGSLYDEAHERPDSFALPAVRALILYPMNAL
ncbi:MAG: DEAD/DEAH box helicase, partial [Myxococcales bacterium]|nr:DEAD/DEAH box helicase [Myxococcales bacterium]